MTEQQVINATIVAMRRGEVVRGCPACDATGNPPALPERDERQATAEARLLSTPVQLAASCTVPVTVIGQRVELHPATDRWMMGDRFGEIVHVGPGTVRVRLDKSGLVRRFSQELLTLI